MEILPINQYCTNGNEIKKYNLKIGSYQTNKKITVYETEQELILKSYETFICVFHKLTGTIINNFESYKISNTTRKHYNEFLFYIQHDKKFNINKEIFLSESDFNNELIKNFQNFGNMENRIYNLIKLYELEKQHINYYLNLENIKQDLKLFENIIKSDSDNNFIKGLRIAGKQKEELKTRIKYNIGLIYINNELINNNKIKILITLTYNKKETKLLNVSSKLINKIGLSFCNYNTKELDQYTQYYYY